MNGNGGPAFPRPAGHNGLKGIDEHQSNEADDGMTLRDYFAAAALTGILANSAWTNRPDKVDGGEEVAAYAHADAMLAERGKE